MGATDLRGTIKALKDRGLAPGPIAEIEAHLHQLTKLDTMAGVVIEFPRFACAVRVPWATLPASKSLHPAPQRR